jgi:hypothetical protein
MLPLTFGTKRAGPKRGTLIRLERLLGASPITSGSAAEQIGPRGSRRGRQLVRLTRVQ